MPEHVSDIEDVLVFLTRARSYLRMDNWDFIIANDAQMEDGIHAETSQTRNHTSALILLSDDWDDLSTKIKRATLLHEMIHAQHRDVSEIWNDCINNNDDISQNEANAWTSDFGMHLERFVSWTTGMLLPGCPQYGGKRISIGPGICCEDDRE